MKKWSIVCGVVLVLVIAAGIAFTSVPQYVSYQGRLLDDTGAPINGTRDFDFDIFDTAVGGTPLWNTTISGVQVNNGLYNVNIGPISLSDAELSGGALYLEVSVAGETLGPRQQIVSNTFSLRAGSVDDDAITSAKISNGTIAGEDVGVDELGTGQIQDVYVLNSGDTITGPLRINAPVGIGVLPSNSVAIRNNPSSSVIGAMFYGPDAIFGISNGQTAQVLGALGFGTTGVIGLSGDSVTPTPMNGANFLATSRSTATGTQTSAQSYGPSQARGILSVGTNNADGNDYGGYFISLGTGTGNHYGIYATTFSPTGTAVHSQGNAHVTGDLTVEGSVIALGGCTGCDYAENFAVTPEVEPGDVVVLDPDVPEGLSRSTRPYDTAVAGIISDTSGIVLGMEQGMPLALVGRARCKVTDENGPIRRGDLLTSSSLPGHAMKITDPTRAIGAIIGKAMEDHQAGEDRIWVFLTLQ